MKKRKNIFVISTFVGTISLVALTTSLVLINEKKKNIQFKHQDKQKEKDKTEILKSLDNYFDNNKIEKQMSYATFNSRGINHNHSSLNQSMKEKAKDFINRVYQKSEIDFVKELKLEVAKAGYNYDEIIKQGNEYIQNKPIKNNAYYAQAFNSSININQTYEQFADELLRSANMIGIEAGIATAIAAAQWAISFFSFSFWDAATATASAAALAAEAIVYRIQYDKLVQQKNWSYLKKIKLSNQNWTNIKYLKETAEFIFNIIDVIKDVLDLIKVLATRTNVLLSIFDFIISNSTAIEQTIVYLYKTFKGNETIKNA